MKTLDRFSDLATERPDPETLVRRTKELRERWRTAATAAEELELLRGWDRDLLSYETKFAIARIRFQQDTADAGAKADQEFFDDLEPTVLELNLGFLRDVTSSAHRSQHEEAVGAQAFALWDRFLQSFDGRIAEGKRRESALWTSYAQLTASIRAPFRGEEHNLSTLRGFFGDSDREVRRDAQRARNDAVAAHADELDRLFDELVGVRDGMARDLGYDDFVPLGYARMERTDYDADDVARFRAAIRESAVPLAQRILERRARTLGLDALAFHDEAVRDDRGSPRPAGDHDWMLERAAEMFAELGDDFAEFFRTMRERELLDLSSRPSKAGGGFCSSLGEYGLPFIFANFNGSQDDVNVFTHECGHAFQNWRSRGLPLRAYRWPTKEAAEIHSMSLELLTHPMMERFFGDDAERFRIGHLEDAILFLPYGAAIDELQHRVYAEPKLSPGDRADVWRELEATYLPHRDYGDLAYFASGRLWQTQRHVYGMPFYYIDYCLAQTCALSMWRSSRVDRAGTLERYRALCDLGGSLPFTGLLESAGLDDPFSDGCLAAVCEDVAAALEL